MSNDRLKFRLFYNGDYSITPYCTIDMNGKVWLDTSIMSAEVFCDPDTDIIDITDKCVVEQCTGLKDKNGNLIYENDILKVFWYGGHYLYFVVEWYSDLRDEVCGFELHETDETGKLLDPNRLSGRHAINAYILENCEIIGNVHTEEQK